MNKYSLVTKILKESPDPLNVRKSTSSVIQSLKLIDVDFEKINDVAKIVKDKISKDEVLTQEQFGTSEPTPQLIFILDCINFCFWAGKNEEKWTVEFPKGNFISNGWYALVASIVRARKESFPILDASYLKNLTQEDAIKIFRSSNSTKIPLLSERVKILNEIGDILLKKYKGDIYNLLARTGLDVSKVAVEVVKNFPSFKDYSVLGRRRINFYKRAQIFAYDTGLLSSLKVKNLEALTAFSDYKVPQTLRVLNILKYKPELAKKIDNYIVLKKDSREEIEIRSAAIWACELIAHEVGIKPVQVDNVLWKMSQGLRDEKPYHRVRTTNY